MHAFFGCEWTKARARLKLPPLQPTKKVLMCLTISALSITWSPLVRSPRPDQTSTWREATPAFPFTAFRGQCTLSLSPRPSQSLSLNLKSKIGLDHDHDHDLDWRRPPSTTHHAAPIASPPPTSSTNNNNNQPSTHQQVGAQPTVANTRPTMPAVRPQAAVRATRAIAQASCSRATPRTSSQRAFSASALRLSGHGPEYDPPTGWLFGVKPGEKYQKEGWEGPFFYGFCGSLIIAAIAYAYKPDTS